LSPVAARAPQEPTADRGAPTLSRRVGTVSRQSEAFAIQWLSQLPATFRTLLYTRTGAIQLCYALLVYHLPKTSQTDNLALLPAHPSVGPRQELAQKLIEGLQSLGDGVRFPVLELAMPALRKLDPEERRLLIANVRKLAAADQRISLFELSLISFLERHLGDDAERAVPVRYRKYKPVIADLERLLGLFARAGTDSREQAEKLYHEAMAGFSIQSGKSDVPANVSLKELHQALGRLNRLSPLLKPAVIDACAHCVTHDGQVAVKEYELMRLVADQLDSPMPPL